MNFTEKLQYVVEITNCSQKVARRALRKSHNNILVAVFLIVHKCL